MTPYSGNNSVFFKSSVEFRKWLEKNHRVETELLVGYYKIGTKKPSMTWSESVDEAICFGWIDGIRKNIDDESYCIRFTPRNPRSNWSGVNIQKAEELIKTGKMQACGWDVFEKRKIDRSVIYSYENQPEKLDDPMQRQFQENQKAWNYFHSQAPSYQKTRIYWVMSAKLETTRMARLEKLIVASESGNRLF